MKKSIIIWIIIIIVIIGVIAVVNYKKPVPREKEKLEVAIIIPLTGPASPTGEDFLNGLLLAQEKYKRHRRDCFFAKRGCYPSS